MATALPTLRPADELGYQDLGWGRPGPSGGAGALVAAARRHARLVAAILLLAVAGGVAVLRLVPPRFTASASLEIARPPIRALQPGVPVALDQAEADRALQTEVDLLTAQAQLIRVADDLGLAHDPRFLAELVAPVPTDAGERRDRVLRALSAGVRVVLPRNSRLVRIEFTARDPVLAARIANGWVDGFIAGGAARRRAATVQARGELDAELGRARARVVAADGALLADARTGRLVDTGEVAGPSLTQARLQAANAALAAARAARVAAAERWHAVAAQPALALPEALGDPAVQQLTRRRGELAGEIDRLNERLKPEHPQVRQAAAELAALDTQVALVAERQRAAVRAQWRVAAEQEHGLAQAFGALQGEALAEQARGIRHAVLRQEVAGARLAYDALLRRAGELAADVGVAPAVLPVDRAEPPRRVAWPRPLPVLALALLAGLMAAALAVAVREWLADSVRSADEVVDWFGLPFLGAVPRAHGAGQPYHALDQPRSGVAEAYRAIRTTLELLCEDRLPPTLLVTSPGRGEGRTVTALALARELAGARRVLLVDADLRQPALHRILGVDGPGLAALLADEETPAAVVRPTAWPGLLFLPAGRAGADPGGLAAGDGWDRIVQAAAAAGCDLVVVDGPPVAGLADAPRLAASAAATLVVLAAGRTRAVDARGALRRLGMARARVAGAVLVGDAAGQPRALGVSNRASRLPMPAR